jgi:hypothetical protein
MGKPIAFYSDKHALCQAAYTRVISQEGRRSKHTLRRSASSRRDVRLQADEDARQKPLGWDGHATEVPLRARRAAAADATTQIAEHFAVHG